MTIIVDELIYRSYAYNRLRDASRPWRTYASIFGTEQTAVMETRFRAEHPDVCLSAAEFMEGEAEQRTLANKAAGPSATDIFWEQAG